MADAKHDKFFSRLIYMMQALTLEKSVTVKELTEMFGVDKRTVYRDIKRLSFFPQQPFCNTKRSPCGMAFSLFSKA